MINTHSAVMSERLARNPLDALAVAVAEASFSRESSQGSELLSTVAPQIPESLIVATKIKRGRPKRAEQDQISEDKLAEVNAGYQQIINQIAQDASEDNGGRRRQFVCTVAGCGKIFYQRAHLNIHIRSHTGYKPYACRYPGCGKSFPQLGNMRTHERIHTGDRPFQCHIAGCEKAFTQMGNLKTHLKKIHNLEISLKSRRGSHKRSMSPLIGQIAPVSAASSNGGNGGSPFVNIVNNSTSISAAALTQLQFQPQFQSQLLHHQYQQQNYQQQQQQQQQQLQQHNLPQHNLPQLGVRNILPASLLANAKLASQHHV